MRPPVTHFSPGRLFAIDMAGFAFKVKALLDARTARFGNVMGQGMLETKFLCEILKIKPCEPAVQNGTSVVHGWETKVSEKVKSRVVGLANDCEDVFVWHTKTKIPSW